jgi:FMN-dependent NADH-azoreductase
MKRVLVVYYTPRDGSNTKKLLDFAVEKVKNKAISMGEEIELTSLDLSSKPVPMFLEKELNIYVKRNFGNQELTSEESEIIKPMDELCDQVLNTDIVIMAYPVYNFTFPGPVKCWFDAVIQAGKAFRYTEHGFEGMLKGKKAIVLTTSGGDYTNNTAWDFSTPLVHSQFNFMGLENKVITAGGMSFTEEKVKESLAQAMSQIEETIESFFVTTQN